MVYCCVPFCKSDASKGKGVSFHEFPAESSLRLKWMENVSRKDWVPQDRSVVCSRHFLDTDYKPGKIRRLKVNAVPTVFEDYPTQVQEVIKKRSKPPEVWSTTKPPTDHDYPKCQKIRRETITVHPSMNVNFAVVDATLGECDDRGSSSDMTELFCTSPETSADINPNAPIGENTIGPNPETNADINPKSPTSENTICLNLETNAKINQKSSTNGKIFSPTVVTSADGNPKSPATGQVFCPIPVSSDDLNPGSPARHKPGRKCLSPATLRKNLHAYGSKVSRQKKQIEAMRKRLKELNQTVKTLSSIKAKITKTECILKDAESGVRSAAFITEQIKMYGRKKNKWSEDIIRECIVWRTESLKGYEYARRSGILKLPSRTTLKRYIGFSTGGTGVSSLIKQRLHKICSRLKPAERYGSILWNEMAITSMSKDRQCSDVGDVDGELTGISAEPAKRLLCFVFNGLNTSLRIPVAYYFIKQLKAEVLDRLLHDVICAVEEVGFTLAKSACGTPSTSPPPCKQFCDDGKESEEEIPQPEDNSQQEMSNVMQLLLPMIAPKFQLLTHD